MQLLFQSIIYRYDHISVCMKTNKKMTRWIVAKYPVEKNQNKEKELEEMFPLRAGLSLNEIYMLDV